jgi:uncharacterized protein HemY
VKTALIVALVVVLALAIAWRSMLSMPGHSWRRSTTSGPRA